MELDIRQYLNTAKEQQDSGALQSAYRLINDMTAAGARGPAPGSASELYVLCAEAAVQLGCLEISTACLKMYFEGNPPANQFLCRAYLCQVRLKSPPPPGSLEDLEEAVLYFLKAIEIAKHEPRDYFIVFNASVLYFQTVCLFLQPGWCSHLVPSLRQVVRSLEEVAEQDHSWRAELMMHLIGCIVDSGIIEDAASFAKETEEFIKAHTPHLYPRIFKLLVQHRLTNADDLIETSTQSTTLVVIYKIQEFKKLEEINVDEPTKEELEMILHILMDCTKYSPSPLISSQGQTPVQPADRVGFLLELALLALQVKHQEVAADSIGQLILIECVNCEINLLKREAKINDYSKASVEARLREIGKLDQCLQTAVRGGDLQAMQAVCVTQWSCCLPLLQHNLKKRIQSPLLRVSHVLEDMQSMLLEMRCQVHSELAVIEEEDGRLEASLTHLQKAMLLDNGTQQERLSSAVRLLQLRGTLYQTTSRAEDKAAMLMQQARDMQPQDRTDIRPILVAVGLLLSPDDFQILCAKAQHHSTSVRKVDRYLARQGDDTDNTERCSEEESCAECLHGCNRSQTCVRDLLRLLADIHFISAEASIQKLLAEGGQLNSPVVPAVDSETSLSEEDPHWVVYRDWIQALSAYATSSFLRAAELGAEIREPWVVANAAVYLWNYSSHLLAAGEYHRLLPTFHSLVAMLQKTEFARNGALFVLLCDAVARGLIQPLCGPDSIEPAPPADRSKNRPEKGMEKAASGQGVFLDPVALQDVRKALELCDYALSISTCNTPGKTVPIAARKQVVATWVQIKRLLQQHIGTKVDTKDECENEEVSAMTRVLVAVEMLQCNRNPRHMEFSVPSLSTLVSMASECSWTDAVVELQVWCQLAAFCHHTKDHSTVYGLPAVNEMLSSAGCLRALSLVHESSGDLHTYREALNVLLSSLRYCLHSLYNAFCRYKLLLNVLFLVSLHLKCLISFTIHSYAEKAENPALCVAAARHYWNTCLPLTHTPEERWQLKQPLENILTALLHTNARHAN
ncbi:hypothetical protein F7725_024441, partial [Dissostichus mawsoni]